MTPFPETEIMTIKKIEVALRKLDFKLLKDGAYKLHEKFHSGHNFEFVDMLKDLYITISKNTTIPNDIKGLLIPTIEDILNKQDVILPSNNQFQSQNINQTPIANSQTVNQPFQEFISTPPRIQAQQPQAPYEYHNEAPQTPIQQQSPIQQQTQLNLENQQTSQQNIPQPPQQPQAPIEPSYNEAQRPTAQTNSITLNSSANYDIPTISVFYGAQTTKEQEERIYQYKKLITENAGVNELANLTYQIISSENIDITDLSLILNILKQKNNNVNLLTNSKSEKMVKVLEDSGLNWSLFDFTKEKKKIKFYPVLGLNGLFKCKKCKREHFEIWDETMPLSLLCPNCKSPMYIDFAYSNDLDLSINMEYYNASICALTESKIWLLVNPPVFDKIIIDMLKSALKISKIVEEIYIVSPNVEVLDKYKSVFYSTGKNVRIDAAGSSLNNFWQAI